VLIGGTFAGIVAAIRPEKADVLDDPWFLFPLSLALVGAGVLLWAIGLQLTEPLRAARRQRQADAKAAVQREDLLRQGKELRQEQAKKQKRRDREAEVDRWIWTAGHYRSMVGDERSVGISLDVPSAVDPSEHSEWTASCIVRHGENIYTSEELPIQGRTGFSCGFPQHFSPRLGEPLPPGHFEVEWTLGFDGYVTRHSFDLDDGGNLVRP
jgi:hypothetical protein